VSVFDALILGDGVVVKALRFRMAASAFLPGTSQAALCRARPIDMDIGLDQGRGLTGRA